MTTSDDWFIPGGAFTPQPELTIRLRPPKEWRRIEIVLPRVAPSMNENVMRGRGRDFQALKKEWQSEIEILLMERRAIQTMPVGGYQRAAAGCFMRFRARKERRDSPNFRPLVDKALGDALVNFGLIPDDDDLHYFFGGVEIDPDTGPVRTIIWIYLQPQPKE